MAQKTILITGCSSGIGYDAALRLREAGWRVFASCRAQDDVQTLKTQGFESLTLDYADEASISAAVNFVLNATDGWIDALHPLGRLVEVTLGFKAAAPATQPASDAAAAPSQTQASACGASAPGTALPTSSSRVPAPAA